MTLFIIVDFVAISFAFVSVIMKNKYILLFGSFVLFLAMALRFDYGNDYNAYAEYFSNLQQGLFNSLLAGAKPEPGFRALGILLSPFGFRTFLVLSSVLYLWTFVRIVLKTTESYYRVLALLVLLLNPYLFMLHLSSMRQTVAIVIILGGVSFFESRWQRVVCVFIASMFHMSALLVIPILLLLGEKPWSFYLRLIVAIIFISLFFFGDKILEALVTSEIRLLVGKYGAYVTRTDGAKFGVSFLVRSLLFYLHLYAIDRVDGKRRYFIKLSIVYYLILPIAAQIIMLGRVAMYFEPFTMATIPIAISTLRSKYFRLFISMLIIIFYFSSLIAFFHSNEWGPFYMNYRSVLESIL